MAKPSKAPPPKSSSGKWTFILLLALVFGLAMGGTFILLQKSKKRAPAENSPTESLASTMAADHFAGSKSCEKCHAEQFQSWTNSHHALAERDVSVALDLDAFEPEREIKHGTQLSRAARNGSHFEMVTLVAPNERKGVIPKRVIGVEPLRQYLVETEGGRLQTLEVAFDPKRKEWFDVFGDEDRVPGEWGHWTGRGMTWNSMCANCHNTNLKKNYDFATDTYHTTMSEIGVGCEACHGPMKKHVAWQEQHTSAASTGASSYGTGRDPTIRKMARDDYLNACGQCHARRAELTPDFVAGESFFDHFGLTIPDETDIFHPDGQVRDEDYEFTSFLSSKMHSANVRCIDCHNSHSAKTKLTGNALCLQCHNGSMTNAPVIEPAAHSFHQADQPGGNCVDCHMPLTTYMQRHPRRDHSFSIPDPLLTKEIGVPNACNRCHADQSTDWAIKHVEKWYGDKMNRPERTRTRVIAEARAGKDVSEALVKLLREEKIPLWRAVAATLLRNAAGQPHAMGALISATMDAHPLVRASAARAIAPLQAQGNESIQTALRSLLTDPVRSVRIEAAWALHENLDLDSVAGRDLLAYLKHNSDQPIGALQLGNFHLSRNESDKALSCLQRAVGWDKHSAPLRHDYAIALSVAGKNAEAIAQLKEAARLAPREAEYRFKLALAYNETGNSADVISALEETVKIDPQHARAWYNLGLAYSGAEKLNKAVEALEKAEAVNRSSADIPYARATILARMGLVDEARQAAKRALSIQPAFTQATQLLRQLEAQ